jgi:teichuronic acid biosynthesis glycosyltransferase TuaG
MVSWNRGFYLVQSVESIQNQTHTNWELIIVDNGSHDKLTLDILDYLENGYGDPRIKVFRTNSAYGIPSIPRDFGL